MGDALDDIDQLPGHVEGVLHAGVHALAPHRNVDVGRIPSEEDASLPVLVGELALHAYTAEPDGA